MCAVALGLIPSLSFPPLSSGGALVKPSHSSVFHTPLIEPDRQIFASIRLSDKTSRRLSRECDAIGSLSRTSSGVNEVAQSSMSLRHVPRLSTRQLRPLPSAGVTVSAGLRTPLRTARWPVPHGRPVGPVIPDLTTLWGMLPVVARARRRRACRHVPRMAAKLGFVFARSPPGRIAFRPGKLQSGPEPAHRPFRGLLGVSPALRPTHSRRSPIRVEMRQQPKLTIASPRCENCVRLRPAR